MLLPKRVKHRRQFRGSMAGKATRGNKITNGEYGIVATEPCWIKSNQIEAARIAMTRYIKRGGKVFIKIFPDKPVTGKPIGVRMGKGKGNLECWVAVVKPGRVMFEISGVPEETAREALRLATHKLPCKCKVVSRTRLLPIRLGILLSNTTKYTRMVLKRISSSRKKRTLQLIHGRQQMLP